MHITKTKQKYTNTDKHYNNTPPKGNMPLNILYICVYIYVVDLLLVLFLLFASGVLILQSPFNKNMFAKHGAGQKARMASTTFSPRSRT